MKKLLAALFVLLPLAVNADDYGMKVPEWKDFAPSAFVDVKEPKMIGKLNVTASYWYKRRVDFEAGLAECQALATYEERFTCYENLKIKQFKENSDYNARIEARRQLGSGPQQMNSMTDTMLPLNNYVNNFTKFQPNEFR